LSVFLAESLVRLTSILVMAAVCLPGVVHGQAETRHVLVLHSESKFLPANLIIDQSIRATMSTQTDVPLDFYSEFLDQTRLADPGYETLVKDFLKQKYATQRIDLVIAFAPAAIAFLEKYRLEVFPGAPVVFCGVTANGARNLHLGPHTTGVSIVFDSAGTLDLALRLQPDTKHVVVVKGNAKVEEVILGAAREGFTKYDKRLDFRYLTNLSLAEVQDELARLPDRTIVFYISILQDAKGAAFTGQQALGLIAARSRAPIYGLLEPYLGHGIVGGRLTNFEWHGRQAALLGLRILRGEEADSIPPTTDEGVEPFSVDWNQLKRFKLDEGKLPAGTRLQFRQVTAWELYKWRIFGIVALCVLEGVLTGALLLQRRKRQLAREALAESEERLRSIINNTGAMIYLKSPDGKYVLTNKQFEKVIGIENDAIVGKTDYDIFQREVADRLRANDLEVLRSRAPLEFEESVSQNGIIHTYVSIKVPLLKDREPYAVCGISTDITSRKETEEALRSSQALSRSVLRSFPGLMVITDRQGTVIDKNQGANPATEIPGPLSGLNVGDNYLELWRHQRDTSGASERIVAGVLSVLNGELETFSIEFSGQGSREERSIEMTVQPLLREQGGAVIFHADVTQRKVAEVELQRHREELTHFARVAAMGELTASLAHELNQPLAAILTNTQAAQRFLQSSDPDLEELRSILADVIADDRRAGDVIRRLRALLKREKLEMVAQDLNTLTEEVHKLVRSDAIIKGIDIELELAPQLPPVRGDRVQLQQVILNLMLNAIDAMSDCPKDQRRLVVTTHRASEGLIQLDVQDTGAGIPESKLEQIFDAFYTTKTEGMGMGLSISRSIIELHGGRLWATNNPGRGATFHFTLVSFKELS
jgi:PAS domain S-box-containing protein